MTLHIAIAALVAAIIVCACIGSHFGGRFDGWVDCIAARAAQLCFLAAMGLGIVAWPDAALLMAQAAISFLAVAAVGCGLAAILGFAIR